MIRTKFIHSLIFLFFFGMIILVAGCGKLPNPDGRLDVSGKITLNGGPFEGAEMCSIRFSPCDDNPQNDANFTTFNSKTGKFLMTLQDGLKPGKYRVTINATAIYDRRTGKPNSPETREGDDYLVFLVPKEYNEKNIIEFEVVDGQKNVFNYDVKTDLITEEIDTKRQTKGKRRR